MKTKNLILATAIILAASFAACGAAPGSNQTSGNTTTGNTGNVSGSGGIGAVGEGGGGGDNIGGNLASSTEGDGMNTGVGTTGHI